MTEKVESELDRAYSQIKAMGEEIDRLRAGLAKAEERAEHFEQEYIKAQSSAVIKTKLLEQTKDDLARAAAEIERLRDQARQLMNERDALRGMSAEIDRLRGHIQELTKQRNALQDMAKAAAKFGDLGGER